METTYLPNSIIQKIYNYSNYRYRHYRRKRITKIRKGIPCNFEWNIINRICIHLYNSEIVSVKYQKLSAWKKAGTFRMFIRLQNGRETSLIYKYCNYNFKDYPALNGYPIKLGPSEFVIGKIKNEDINTFLPKTYWSYHDKNDVYHYIVEDLELNGYKTKLSPDDIIVETLVSLNKSLNASNINRSALPYYDKNYSLSLIEYIRRLWDYSWDEKYDMSFRKLDKIFRIYLDFSLQDKKYSIIHGDFNYSNIHLKDDRNMHLFKMVDWEWAGIGIIHSDLAAYFRDPDYPDIESHVKKLTVHEPWGNYDYHYKWMNWAFMDRAFLDMSYMIAQKDTVKRYSVMDIERFIHEAIDNLLKAYIKVQEFV